VLERIGRQFGYEAMVRLTRSPELRKLFGEGGKLRVRNDNLDWKSKADRILSILADVSVGSHDWSC
jgi:hypothetical protein